jgi:OOP family OmpA-OmpF porin
VARIETLPAPPPPPAPTPAQVEAKACEDRLAAITNSEPILFGFDSARVDTGSRPTLDKLAEAAKTCTDMHIEIAGHASAEGTAAFNRRLSLRRARSVAAYLLRAGVSAEQLKAVGYGASQPKAPNDTDENKAINRRIEFIVRPN